MWNLREDEIARKIQAIELPGVWAHDVRVDEGTIALLLVDEKLDRVLGPGLVRVDAGLLQFFGLGKKKSVVLARSGELSLEFSITKVLTKDPVFLDFNCKLRVKLKPEDVALFLRNILAGRDSLTFDDLKRTLGGELKEVAQSFLSKRSIAELADHLEIKPELEAEIELNIKKTLDSAGLAFLRLSTADFHCDAWNEQKQAAVLITEEKARQENKKRLNEVFSQNELDKLVEETRKVEGYEKRIQLWDRMRRAAQSDKMNEVRSEQALDEFLHSIDKDKLLKEMEYEEFKRNLRDKLDDRERARAHLVRMFDLKSEYEYRNQELSLQTGLTQAQQQLEADLQARRLKAELEHTDVQLAIQKKKGEAAQAAFQMMAVEANAKRAQELGEVQHQAQIEHIHRSQERDEDLAEVEGWMKIYKIHKETKLDLAAKEAMQRVETERLELENKEKQMRIELQKMKEIDTMSDIMKVFLADTPDKAKHLTELVKTKYFLGQDVEKTLAIGIALGNSPQAAEVLKAMIAAKTATLVNKEDKDLYERRTSEQTDFRKEMQSTNDKFIETMKEVFFKTLDVQAQIAQAKGKDKAGG